MDQSLCPHGTPRSPGLRWQREMEVGLKPQVAPSVEASLPGLHRNGSPGPEHVGAAWWPGPHLLILGF